MKPKIIAIASTKGGVGKTTLAVQLAIAQAKEGKEVWLIDGDRQQTAQNAIALRDSQKRVPGIACACYSDGNQLRAQVKLQANKWDNIIIDVGGFDSTALRASLALCDVLLVPFQPRSFDVWGVSQMTKLIRNALLVRDPFPAYAILNMADPTETSDNVESVQALEEFSELKFLNTPLRRRKVYATASGFGIGVSEMKTKDPKAVSEIKALREAVFDTEI